MIFKRKKFFQKDYFNLFFIFLIISILFSYNIFSKTMTWRTDAYFHLSRIHDMTASIQHGKIPLLVNINSFANVGQALNGLYPSFSLLPFIWITSMFTPIVQYGLINFLYVLVGSVINYFVFQKLGSSKIQSLIAVIVILGLIDTHNFGSFALQGSWSSYFTLPTVLLSMQQLYKNNYIYVLPLAMAVAFTINIHVLSAIFLIVFIILYFMYLLFISQNKFILIKNFSVAAVISVLLSSSTLVALFMLSKSQLSVPIPVSLAQQTVSLESMIYSLSNPIVSNYVTSSVPSQGIMLIFDVIIFFNWKNISRFGKQLIIAMFILQIIISPIFPWQLFDSTPLQNLQFPARLVPFILAVFITVIFTQKKFHSLSFLLPFAVMGLFFAITYQTNDKIVKTNFSLLSAQNGQYNLSDLNQNFSTTISNKILQDPDFYTLSKAPEYSPEYAIPKSNFDNVWKTIINHKVYNNGNVVNNVKLIPHDNKITYVFSSPVSGNIDLPFWKYKNMDYIVLNDNQEKLAVKVSNRSTIYINSNQPVSKLSVVVRNPIWYILSMYCSIVFWIVIIIFSIYFARKQKDLK